MSTITKYALLQPGRMHTEDLGPHGKFSLWTWLLDPEKDHILCYLDTPTSFIPEGVVKPIPKGSRAFGEGFQSYFPTDEKTHWPCMFEVWTIETS